MQDNFDEAFENGELNEGGYCRTTLDRGGETYEGCARNDWPNNPMWAKIDAWKAVHGTPPYNHKFTDIPGLEDDVKQFLRDNFWIKMDGPQIVSRKVAIFFYDWFINSMTAATRHLQGILGINPATGFFGPITLQKVNEAGDGLLDALHDTRDKFYSDHVAAVPSDAKFLSDWERRSNELYAKLKAS